MDIDGDDTLEILVVNSLGTIRMYEINADQVSGEFKQIDSFYHFPAFQLRKFYTPDMGNQTSIALADLNSDSVPEIVIGNNRGGIKYLKPLFYRKGGNVSIPIVYTHKQIHGFPNPGDTKIEFLLGEEIPGLIQVTDVLGRSYPIELDSTQIGRLTLNTTQLPSGIYLIRIECESGIVYTSKVQIIH